MQTSLYKKSMIAFSVVVLTATVGVFSARAIADDKHGDNDNNKSGYYNKDQCKDGGFKNFKNPDGSQKFKNQGQCVSFFNHENGKGNEDEDNNNQGDDNDQGSKHHQASGSTEHDD